MKKFLEKVNRRLGYPTFHAQKRFFFGAQNPKQLGWAKAMKKLRRNDLVVLETGRIRNPDWHFSDGYSTYFFTRIPLVKKLISVDNDSENESGFSTSEKFCRSFLDKLQLSKLEFINGDSRKVIAKMPSNRKLDVVLLDSANDPELIFDEFMAVKEYMRRDKSLLIVDDVEPPGKKGSKLVPFLEKKGIILHRIVAPPYSCAYAILTEKDFEAVSLNKPT